MPAAIDENTQTLSAEPEIKTTKFPSAFTVLGIVLLLMWMLTFIIPTGAYKVDEKGRAIAGSYHEIPSPMTIGGHIHDLFMSFVNGTYGIRDSKTGIISAGASGDMYGAIQVFLFVMVIGMFITMCNRSGALTAGVGAVAKKLGNKGIWMIISLMIIFSALGSVEGFGEETLGLYALFVPLMLSLGYDRLTAAATLMLGAGMGVMASTVNPFATGVASQVAGVSLTNGMGLRLIMWVTFTAVGCWWVVRYASKVRKDPSKSLCEPLPEDTQIKASFTDANSPVLNWQRRSVLLLFVASFTLMVFSFIPWAQVTSGSYEAQAYWWELGWYMPEATSLFLVVAIIAGLIMRMGEKELTDTLVQGAADFAAPALIIALARAVTVIMDNGAITATILHFLENSLAGLPNWLFLIVLYVVYIPLSFLVPSTSGLAALSMPIFGQLTHLHSLDPALAVTAFQAASGWMNLFTPTSAIIMGGLALSRVGFNKWLKFIAPLLGIYFVLGCLFMVVGTLL